MHGLDWVIEVQLVSGDSAANSHNMTDSYNTYPTLATVSKAEYDGAGVGDTVTSRRQRSTSEREPTITRDEFQADLSGHVRDVLHERSTETLVGPYPVQDVDWYGRTTTSALYDTSPTWSSVLTGDGYTAYAASTATNRRSKSETLHDDLGRVYQIRKYEISSSTGSGSNYSTMIHYHDRNGQRVGGICRIFAGGRSLRMTVPVASTRPWTVTDLDSGLYASGKTLISSRLPIRRSDR